MRAVFLSSLKQLLLVFLMVAILPGVRWNLSVIYDLHFPLRLRMLKFLHVLIDHLYFFLKLSVQVIFPLMNWAIYSFGI
jgi:hypothetical protein